MEKKTHGFLELFFSVGIVLAVFYFSNDLQTLGSLGYLGVFAITMLSAATLFLPAPGWAVVVGMSSTLDPVLLGVVAGIGSSIGELTGYFAGEGICNVIDGKIKEKKKIEDLVKKYDVFGIGLLAFIPNPFFDVAGIVAGGLKIQWWRFLIACSTGRVLRYISLAIIGKLAFGMF